MSTIKVTNLRHESASSSNITLDSSNNVTTANNFTAGGTIGCTGNLTVTSGNVVLTSGNGIDFSATANSSGTMSSELLDDYEEGTWTPVLSEEGGSPTIGYGFQNGRYVKVGSSVMIYATIRVNSLSGSGSNPLKISGFPFSISSSSTTLVTSLDVGLIAGSWSSNFPGRIYWREGQTSAYVGISNSTAIVVGTNLTSTSEIGFSGCYTTGLT